MKWLGLFISALGLIWSVASVTPSDFVTNLGEWATVPMSFMDSAGTWGVAIGLILIVVGLGVTYVGQQRIKLDFEPKSEWLQRTVTGKVAIRLRLTVRWGKPLLSGVPYIETICRMPSIASLNSNNKVRVAWGVEPFFNAKDVSNRDNIIILNHFVEESRLAIFTNDRLPSFQNKDNLPAGKYKIRFIIETNNSGVLKWNLLLDWFGQTEDMVIRVKRRWW